MLLKMVSGALGLSNRLKLLCIHRDADWMATFIDKNLSAIVSSVDKGVTSSTILVGQGRGVGTICYSIRGTEPDRYHTLGRGIRASESGQGNT